MARLTDEQLMERPRQGQTAALDAFLDTLAEHYGAGLRVVDFAQSEEARQPINQWISDQTERRIHELLRPRSTSASIFGVMISSLPKARMVSKRWSSVKKKRTLGRFDPSICLTASHTTIPGKLPNHRAASRQAGPPP